MMFKFANYISNHVQLISMKMDYKHPQWNEFLERLAGPEGINYLEDPKTGKLNWECKGGEDKTHAIDLMKKMGLNESDIKKSIKFFNKHGGYCDCEILLNVNDD